MVAAAEACRCRLPPSYITAQFSLRALRGAWSEVQSDARALGCHDMSRCLLRAPGPRAAGHPLGGRGAPVWRGPKVHRACLGSQVLALSECVGRRARRPRSTGPGAQAALRMPARCSTLQALQLQHRRAHCARSASQHCAVSRTSGGPDARASIDASIERDRAAAYRAPRADYVDNHGRGPHAMKHAWLDLDRTE
jgi:hypothetical protein